jgi:hypothetical protein
MTHPWFTSRSAVRLTVAAGLIALLADGAQAQSDPLKCQRTLVKTATKFFKAKTKALQKCEEGKVKGKHGDTCPDATAPAGSAGRKAADAIAKASSKLHAGIAKQCGGPDKLCGTPDDDLDVQADLGFPASCAGLEGACAASLDDCADVATCLECLGEHAVDRIIDRSYDGLASTSPSTQAALNGCQVAIGKATAQFALAKEKALAQCWDARYRGKHAAACPDANADPASAKDAVKAAAKIAKAESKKIAKICKACGGLGKRCRTDVGPVAGDGVADDFAPPAIGFPSACDAVVVPAPLGVGATPAPCGGTVTTLEDLIRCIDCVAEFQVDCVTRALVPPLAGAEPAECNPPTPTATPTPTPTGPTPTGTPSPMPTLKPCEDVADDGSGATIYQCDGLCPPGQICVTIDNDCRCDPDASYEPCGSGTWGPPLCYGTCANPAMPICRDFDGTCACSPY